MPSEGNHSESPPLRHWVVLSDGVQSDLIAEPELRERIANRLVHENALVSCGNGWKTASEFLGKIGTGAPVAPVATELAQAITSVTPPTGASTGELAPAPQHVSPPPQSAPLERDRIVVLGRRNSGKTLYLSTLYESLWRAKGGLSAQALSGEVHQYLMTNHAALKSGKWPSATLAARRLELEIEYEKHKHLLVGLDFAGETFARAFLREQGDAPDARELLNHIDRAAAVLLLVDPSVGVGNDHQAAMEDDFGLVQAVQRIRNWPGGDQVPIVIVLTKIDQYQHLVAKYGGLTELVRRQFPALVRIIKQVMIFQVSAVQVTRNANGSIVPAPKSAPINIASPLKHCLKEIDRIKMQDAQLKAEAERFNEDELAKLQQACADRRRKVWMIIIVTLMCAGIAGAVVGLFYLVYGH